MSNLFIVYSPKGEKFEVTRPNYNDLMKVAGWSNTASLAVAAATVEPAPAPAPETPAETPQEPAAPVEAPEAPETSETAPEAPKPRLTVEDFADLADKDAVKAYIVETFPEAKIDGRANRDKLIALAIDLAAA